MLASTSIPCLLTTASNAVSARGARIVEIRRELLPCLPVIDAVQRSGTRHHGGASYEARLSHQTKPCVVSVRGIRSGSQKPQLLPVQQRPHDLIGVVILIKTVTGLGEAGISHAHSATEI
ncbi:hypothetical protein [Streptomyces xantholiticus]|uniref:hypothetical protein n=1 Tax=Streptomyces xantholiticus TaxID=68285 RepID=UPI00167BFFBA|nr:hypothetical protein [Streptomyces xantholiticus]GGW69922.1 hypothetical protein GCM10010381_63430 [Streptomyces xantholiticus]